MAISHFINFKENLGSFLLFNAYTFLAILISSFDECLQFMETNIEVMSYVMPTVTQLHFQPRFRIVF
jgi:hypothetical protein